MFTVQKNKIDFSFLSTFIMSVQMNAGHIPARSIFMQPTLERARELLQSSRGAWHFFSYGFLFSPFFSEICLRDTLCLLLIKGSFNEGRPPLSLWRGDLPPGRAARDRAGNPGAAGAKDGVCQPRKVQASVWLWGDVRRQP